MATDQDPHSELKAQFERDRVCYPDAQPLWEYFSYSLNRWGAIENPGFYLDGDYRRVDHPDYPPIPAPPEGWTLYGMGPLPDSALPGPDDYGDLHFFSFILGRWCMDHGATGDSKMVYLVRTGSPLARKLGIPEPVSAEPEPVSAEPEPVSAEPVEPTTVRGWLETLPDGYRERALASCDCPDDRCCKLSDAILQAMEWGDTPEGVAFWCQVYDWARGRRDLPPLPEPATPSHPEPPDGWIYYGPGPVPGHEKFRRNPCPDLATYSGMRAFGWDTSPSEGYCCLTVYAVRAGSALARELGLEPTEPTTIRGWLETLPDGYRERALANCTDRPDRPAGDLEAAIVRAFCWEETPEGMRFWDKVHAWCRDNSEPLPPLPGPAVNTATEPEIPGGLVSRLHAALLSADPTGDPDMLAARAVAHARALVQAMKGGAGE